MFRIGDEVLHPKRGMGTVKCAEDEWSVGVAYHKWNWGHDLGGILGKDSKNGWFEFSTHLTLVPLDLENV